MFLLSFISWSAQTFCLLPTLGTAFQCHSNPITAGWPTPHKADSNFLPAAGAPAWVLPNLSFAFAHSLPAQKNSTRKKAQWTASWHSPQHSQWHLPLFHQPQNSSQHAAEKGQKPNNYTPVEESYREQGHLPQCLRTSKQWGVCSVEVEVNKPCACSTALCQSDEGEKSYLMQHLIFSSTLTTRSKTHQKAPQSFKSSGRQHCHCGKNRQAKAEGKASLL